MSTIKPQIAQVHYQLDTISGTIHVPCYSDFSDDVVKAKARATLQAQVGKYLPASNHEFQIRERR